MLKLKRAYEPASPDDGERILVERLWPRGLTKAKAAIDLWLKDIAPSTELRKWFGHDPDKWKEFQKRYRKELQSRKDAVALLREKAKRGVITLVYAARDEDRNSARVLMSVLDGGSGARKRDALS
jgi:uncharacterized protein YeaO (DUF488 family)